MPGLRRRPQPEPGDEPPPPPPVLPGVPWHLTELLRDGPEPTEMRRPWSEKADVGLVVVPGVEAGWPTELLRAVEDHDVRVRRVPPDQAASVSDADVVLALGWPAAPAVLRTPGVRARAVLATTAPMPLPELGWADPELPVLGPSWMGGTLGPGADVVYAPKPVHRRDDLVLVHGEDPFGLLAAALLHERRDGLAFAVSGVRPRLALPFEYLPVEPGPAALAHAFSSAAVAFAPRVRGWRPAAAAMMACGQAVVAPDDASSRAALGDAASLAAGPIEAADAAEELLDDLDLRAGRVRAATKLVDLGWGRVARDLTAQIAALL